MAPTTCFGCRASAFLERVTDGRLEAVTSVEVIQEILHRFTAIGRSEVGAAMARDALDLFAPVLPVTHAIMRRMPDLVARHPGLAARNLVHVAPAWRRASPTS